VRCLFYPKNNPLRRKRTQSPDDQISRQVPGDVSFGEVSGHCHLPCHSFGAQEFYPFRKNYSLLLALCDIFPLFPFSSLRGFFLIYSVLLGKFGGQKMAIFVTKYE